MKNVSKSGGPIPRGRSRAHKLVPYKNGKLTSQIRHLAIDPCRYWQAIILVYRRSFLGFWIDGVKIKSRRVKYLFYFVFSICCYSGNRNT